jgi:Peptidase family S41
MKALFAAALLLLVPSLAEAAGSCVHPDTTGLYSGTVRDSQGENIDITLNLYCDGGKLAAQIFTSMGDFSVTAAKVTQEGVSISFDSGAALGTIELARKGDALTGSVDMAGDKGTIGLSHKGDALAADAMDPDMNIMPAQWHADLSYLATELPKRHANAFFFISKEDFAREVAALDKRIDTANSDEIFVGLQQIVKSIGDGHTGIGTPPPDRRVMPLAFARFGNDFRVVAVGPGLDAALGTRLLKIGDMPVADAWQRALTLTSQAELMEEREDPALTYLARGYSLHGLDIIPDRNVARYTLEDDQGRISTIDVKGLAPDKTVDMKSAYSDSALRFQNKDTPFWCKPLPEAGAVYCGWHAYQDLAAKAKKMFAAIDAMHAKKLIIDMRDNGGGDNTVGYAEIIKPIEARADTNAIGHLYVLVGADTFSAAMNNAAQFQDETKAILVGQTIGEKPNSYQEPRQFRLPNSHLVVRASTLYYEFRKHGENAVRPNKEIVPTWDDVKAGRDPVLDWVLAQKTD